MKNLITVGIADMKVSDSPEEILVTYSLGSCIAVVLYDPFNKIGGMLHVMLPDSSIEKDKSNLNPFKYVTTGLPKLYKEMYVRGANRNNIITKLVGGSNILDKNDYFNIGKRNYTAIRKMLWKNNLKITAEDIGGTKSRTVKLYISDGSTVVSNAYEEYKI